MSDYKIPNEFITWIAEVMEFGARKYGDENWKEPDGNKSSHNDMHASMFRHLAASQELDLPREDVVMDEEAEELYIEWNLAYRADEETRYDPLQHLATRALMTLWRKKQGLK